MGTARLESRYDSTMTKFLIALVVVLAVLAGGWIALLRARRLPLPPQDVLDRVRQREQVLEAQEKDKA
jgi:hypothetical protein